MGRQNKMKKKIPLSVEYCNFLKELKKTKKENFPNVIKNLPNVVINVLSEVMRNGVCGNITKKKNILKK